MRRLLEGEREELGYYSLCLQLGGSSDYSRPSWSEEADEVANMWRERYESEAKKVIVGVKDVSSPL